jgi:hypothetical protein
MFGSSLSVSSLDAHSAGRVVRAEWRLKLLDNTDGSALSVHIASVCSVVVNMDHVRKAIRPIALTVRLLSVSATVKASDPAFTHTLPQLWTRRRPGAWSRSDPDAS